MNGRMGRGENAFTGRMTSTWQAIEERMKVIESRNRTLGYIPVSYPLHAEHDWLKGVKL